MKIYNIKYNIYFKIEIHQKVVIEIEGGVTTRNIEDRDLIIVNSDDICNYVSNIRKGYF